MPAKDGVAQATPTLPLALPAPRWHARAFEALERTEARSRMRQSASATWIGSGATLRRFVSPMRVLPEAERRRRVAVASTYVSRLPARHMRLDNHAEAAEARQRRAPELTFTPAQLLDAILSAIVSSKRWQPLPAPVAGAHPDCLCRACLMPVSAERRRQTAAKVAAERQRRNSAAPGERQNAHSAT